jgi:nucleotide-binding universal stress UspA family protein
MTDPRPIVVGYDGRAGSHAALDEALRLAQDLGASVVAVFSFEPTRLGGEVRDLDEAVSERANTVLEEATARAAGTGVTVETVQRQQSPTDGLLAEAEERHAQMVVVGSTGEGPLRGILVGSTPYKLLHLSTRPVLVVRAAG